MTIANRPNIDRGRLDRHLRELEASICRDSFADYLRRGWHVFEPNGRPFVPNMGTDAIVEHLQAVADGKIKKLGIAVAPGFGKTTLCSVAFPSFKWARDATWRVICASHAYELSQNIAGKFHRVVTSDWYTTRFGVELSSDALKAIETTASGRRHAVGVGGALTGLRGNGGIVDDSLNAYNAGSKLAVADVNDWFDTAFSTRFDDGEDAPVIVIQQCLAENDLIAHVRELGYEMLILPARYEAGRKCVTSIWEDSRTEDGEILAPQIHSEKFLDEQATVLGPYGYAAQYQQRPAPLEGGMIRRDWFKRFTMGEIMVDGRLDLDWTTISVDPTGNAKEDGDNVGLLVAGGKGPRRYVLDDASRRMSFLETCAAIRALLTTWPTCKKVLVEKSVVGPAIVEQLRKEVNQGSMRVVVIEELTTHMIGKKEQRALAMVPALAAGLVYLLDGASWVAEFVAEHAMFPNGHHDDRVDALAQLLAHYAPIVDMKARWQALSS